MHKNSCELAVIGAGISGLGFAHLAHKQGIRTLLLESTEHIGGCINTHQFATANGPFWVELGAHTCYNSYGNLLQMLEDTQQLPSLRAKEKLSYRIQTGDGLRSIMSEFNFLELLAALPKLWTSKKAGRSVADYYAGIIGQRNYRQVLGPALNAVACQPAGEMPADALFRKKPRRKEVLRSYTGPAGLQSLVDGIAAQPGLEIRTSARVTGLQSLEDGYQITIDGADPVQAQRIVFAVAPDVAARIIQPMQPQLAVLLAGIKTAEIDSVTVLLNSDSVAMQSLAGIIGRDDDFYSVVSRDLVPDSNYRGFTFHFKPGRLTAEQKTKRICQVLGVTEADILDQASIVNSLPALRVGHEELIAEVDQQLQGKSMGLTGNWFTGVSIEDSLVRTAQEFQRLFPPAV